MEEKSIIIGCKKKDRRSQRAFVDQYSSYLFGVCIRYVKSEFDAKDCLQDSLIRILNKIDLYSEDHGYFKGWISKLTANQCLSFLRKNNRVTLIELEDTEEIRTEEVITKKLELEDVLKFMNDLPEKYRIAINMYVIEGYTHKEIAQIIGLNESSSRSLVSRARKLLAEKFEEKKSIINEAEKGRVIDLRGGKNIKIN